MQSVLERPLETKPTPTDTPTPLTDQEKLRLLFSSPEPFRRWLKSMPADEIVGRSRQGRNCPIYHWLKGTGIEPDRVKPLRVAVGHRSLLDKFFCNYSNLTYYSLPTWATNFIRLVDRQRRYTTVTGSTALQYLSKVTGKY